MKLVVLSPESDDPRENTVLPGLFAAGLERYHVRKPQWSREKLVTWLQVFPVEWQLRMVLHQHHELINGMNLGGIHWRDDADAPVIPVVAKGLTSRACHDLRSLRPALGCYDAVLLSPVFPSISKPGYQPRIAHAEVRGLLHARTVVERRTSVIALGGVTPENCARCAELGFDGVAVLGAIWQAADPLAVFQRLKTSLVRHAA